MWRHSVQMEAKMRDLGVEWPRFNDNEMGDLIAFVQSRVGAR